MFVDKHEHNKKFFKEVEGSWNKDTINILSRTHERKFPHENFSKVFVQQQWTKNLSKVKYIKQN